MEEDLSIPKKRKTSWKSVDMAGRVRSFFLRDDVSRMTPGSKHTITRKKQKMQKKTSYRHAEKICTENVCLRDTGHCHTQLFVG